MAYDIKLYSRSAPTHSLNHCPTLQSVHPLASPLCCHYLVYFLKAMGSEGEKKVLRCLVVNHLLKICSKLVTLITRINEPCSMILCLLRIAIPSLRDMDNAKFKLYSGPPQSIDYNQDYLKGACIPLAGKGCSLPFETLIKNIPLSVAPNDDQNIQPQPLSKVCLHSSSKVQLPSSSKPHPNASTKTRPNFSRFDAIVKVSEGQGVLSY